ncbi:MAG TPA: NAD(P)/FAD-dependent oxidoreductase [Gemmatimonadaceae bacterium]|nr:NAD(P)/FAD-dependent oxidoreductase [Gemmatimonadaceae bacterium]
MSASYEIAIVGGGPAGLTAALFLARYLHSVVLIDSHDPRNWEARGINGYLGLHGITPPELRERGRAEAARSGAILVDGCVSTVREDGEDRFVTTLEGGRTFASQRLLLAIGIKDVWPKVPGLDRCYGQTVHHCPDCDGHEARGKRTVVIASGRSAAGMALSLTTWTRAITICTNGKPAGIEPKIRAKLDALNIAVVEQALIRLESDEAEVRALVLEDDTVVECDRIFFAIGHYPADDLGVQLGCKRDDEGLIVVDDKYRTSVRNVFAAGDITPGPHLAIAAAGGGAVAALAIHASLVPDERKLEG